MTTAQQNKVSKAGRRARLFYSETVRPSGRRHEKRIARRVARRAARIEISAWEG